MGTLKGSRTAENLRVAFTRECEANRRYLYFAKMADIEGYPNVAGLFKEAADRETAHAHGHLDFLRPTGDPMTGRPIGSTIDNLSAALAAETHESEAVYPAMAREAREEGLDEIAEWFEALAESESQHVIHLRTALETLD